MESSSGARVVRNVFFGVVGRISIVALGLVVTSSLLLNLGPERFGLFTILTSFQAYFGVLDLGIGGGLVRFMTIYSERNDAKVVRAITSFGFMFYVVLALVALPFVFLAAPAMTAWLDVSPSLTGDAVNSIYSVFGLFIVSSISGVITARLYSIHRMDIVAASNVISGISYVVATLILLPRYPTIEVAILCLYIQVFVLLFITIVALQRLTGGHLVANPFETPKALLRQLFGFGFWTQINSISAIINLEADKLIIGRYLGVAEVAPYQVGGRLAMLTRALPIQILTAMFPSITARVGERYDIAEMSDVYRSATRTLMLVTLVTVGFPIAVSSSLINVWIGYDLPAAASIAVALMISYSVNNATGVGTLILRAIGLPKYETIYAVCSAAMNIVITILLLPRFGIYGIVYGTICANVISSIGFIYFFHRVVRLDFSQTLFSWLKPLLFSVVAAALLIYGLDLVAMQSEPGRLSQLLIVGVLGVIYLVVVAELLKLTKFWALSDLSLLGRLGATGRWAIQRYAPGL